MRITMFEVVIVEDEPIAAHFIQSILSSDPDYHVRGVYESAEDALASFIKDGHPDLLVTDIKLLGMSGLDLVKAIRKTDKQMLVIIISGYKLFEFAQEAIRLDIMDYLLKPLDPDQLKMLMRRTTFLLSQRKRQASEQVLSSLFEGDNTQISTLTRAFPYPSFRMVLIATPGNHEKNFQTISSRIMALGLSNVHVIGIKHSYTAILLGKENPDLDYTDKIREALNGLHATAIASSSLFSTQDMEQTSVLFLRYLHRYTILGKSRWLHVSDQELKDLSVLSISKPPKQLFDAIYSKNWKEFYIQLDMLEQKWETNLYGVDELLVQLFVIIGKLQEVLKGSINATTLFAQAEDILLKSSSYYQYLVQLKSLLGDVITSAKTQSRQNAQEELFGNIDALLWADPKANYSLEEISQRFHVSQPYISKLFRTYSGQSYKDYVLEKKVKLAIQFMQANPDALIKEIAAHVGIEPLYFSTLFCRMTGESPSQYREHHLAR